MNTRCGQPDQLRDLVVTHTRWIHASVHARSINNTSLPASTQQQQPFQTEFIPIIIIIIIIPSVLSRLRSSRSLVSLAGWHFN